MLAFIFVEFGVFCLITSNYWGFKDYRSYNTLQGTVRDGEEEINRRKQRKRERGRDRQTHTHSSGVCCAEREHADKEAKD